MCMAVRGDSGAAAHDGRCQEAGADGVGVGSSGVATMDGREDAQSATAGGRQRTTMHGAGGQCPCHVMVGRRPRGVGDGRSHAARWCDVLASRVRLVVTSISSRRP